MTSLTLFPVSQQEHDGLQQAQGQYSYATFSQAQIWRVQSFQIQTTVC